VQYFGAFHRGHIFNEADGFVYDRMARHLTRRSQRGVRPPQGTSWYSRIREKARVLLEEALSAARLVLRGGPTQAAQFPAIEHLELAHLDEFAGDDAATGAHFFAAR